MAKSNSKIYVSLLILLLFTGVSYSLSQYEHSDNSSNKIMESLGVSASGVIIDKVFTFTVEEPILVFNNCVWFEANYFYNLSIGVVTPHTCQMVFSFWDPFNTRYDLTFRGLTQIFNNESSSRDKFLAVFNGTYSLAFKAITSENLNIHIKLEKGNKLKGEEPQYITPDMINKTLDTDYYYKVEFMRGSGSVNTSGMIWMDHNVVDPNNVSFNIYNKIGLGDDVLEYMFGTATNGTYIFNMTYYHEQENLIVILTLNKIIKLSNETIPEPYIMLPYIPHDFPYSNNPKSGFETFIPKVWTIGMIIFVGSAVIIPVLIIVYRKKKNPIGI